MSAHGDLVYLPIEIFLCLTRKSHFRLQITPLRGSVQTFERGLRFIQFVNREDAKVLVRKLRCSANPRPIEYAAQITQILPLHHPREDSQIHSRSTGFQKALNDRVIGRVRLRSSICDPRRRMYWRKYVLGEHLKAQGFEDRFALLNSISRNFRRVFGIPATLAKKSLDCLQSLVLIHRRSSPEDEVVFPSLTRGRCNQV